MLNLKMVSKAKNLPPGKVSRSAQIGLRGIIQTASPSARAAVVRAIAKDDAWFGLLPIAIKSLATLDLKVVTPLDYVNIALGGAAKSKGETLVVDGDVRLSQDGEVLFLEGLPVDSSSGNLRTLPSAIIRGDLNVSNLTNLESVNTTTTGNLKLTQLPSLKHLSGEIFGHAVIRQAGLEKIGADFRVEGNLSIFHLPCLKTLNCSVGAEFTVVGSSVESTGPAFSVGKSASFVSCESLAKVGGTVAKEISFRDCPVAPSPESAIREGSPLPLPNTQKALTPRRGREKAETSPRHSPPPPRQSRET